MARGIAFCGSGKCQSQFFERPIIAPGPSTISCAAIPSLRASGFLSVKIRIMPPIGVATSPRPDNRRARPPPGPGPWSRFSAPVPIRGGIMRTLAFALVAARRPAARRDAAAAPATPQDYVCAFAGDCSDTGRRPGATGRPSRPSRHFGDAGFCPVAADARGFGAAAAARHAAGGGAGDPPRARGGGRAAGQFATRLRHRFGAAHPRRDGAGRGVRPRADAAAAGHHAFPDRGAYRQRRRPRDEPGAVAAPRPGGRRFPGRHGGRPASGSTCAATASISRCRGPAPPTARTAGSRRCAPPKRKPESAPQAAAQPGRPAPAPAGH